MGGGAGGGALEGRAQLARTAQVGRGGGRRRGRGKGVVGAARGRGGDLPLGLSALVKRRTSRGMGPLC